MTLKKAEEAFAEGESAKVDRTETELMMRFVEDHISDNEVLERFMASLGFSVDANLLVESSEGVESLEHLYEGVLSREELRDLGVA